MFRVAEYAEVKIIAPVPWFPLSHILKKNYRPSVPRLEVQDGIEVFHPKFFSFPGIFKFLDGIFIFLSLITTLRRVRGEFDFDIIDSHFAYPEGLGAVLLGRVFNCPVTITLRGTIVPLSEFLFRKVQIAFALRKADKIISVSESLKRRAVLLGSAPEKIAVIPNGVDKNKFYLMDKKKLRKDLNLSMYEEIIISVGALVKRKGFHRIIDVMPEIIRKRGRVLYVIIGGPSVEGDFGPGLKKLVSKKKLQKNVIFTGALCHEKIRHWLNVSDIFCLATGNEGWANVFFEAMACGKPVVATRVGGNEEVVKSRDYGILFDINSKDELIFSIVQALDKAWDTGKIIGYASEHDWHKVGYRVYTELDRAVFKYRKNAENKV